MKPALLKSAVTAALLALAGQGARAAQHIDAGNAARLQLVFTLPLGPGAESSPPASAGGLLFVLGTSGHVMWALDPAAPPTQRMRWHHTVEADPRAEGLSCCDQGGRGPVLAQGTLYFATLDGHVLALDAATGKPRFDVAIADASAGETLAAAPVAADGRVLVGNAGDDFGARGWVAALNATSGRMLWKRYSTGPDADVGIDADFKPSDAALADPDLGVKTWPPSAWQHGGGSVSGKLLYDHATRTLFHATGHPAPWNAASRAGDNRWTLGMFARDATTGAARWFASFNPHDAYGLRAGRSDVLMDADWAGRARRLIVHPDANGRVYVLDRESGEILAADAVTPAGAKPVEANRQTRSVCPAWTGAFGAGAGVVASTTLVALPVSRLCMDIEPRAASFIEGTPYVGANVRLRPGAAQAGAVIGWDVGKRHAAWQVAERWPVLGGTLTTAGGLVVYGTLDGQLKALDGRTGQLLWQARSPVGIVSQPVEFLGTDGAAYVAVVAGTGRLFGMSRRDALDPRDDTAGLGWAGLLQRLRLDEDTGSTLLVFRLP